MTRIDITDDIFYPPIPGLGRLRESAVQRIVERFKREREQRPQGDAARFRVISKDEEGRTIVGEWS